MDTLDTRDDPELRSPDGRVRLRVERRRVGDAVDAAALRWGDRAGWSFGGRDVGFGEMKRMTDRTARALMAAGIGQGDVVATLMPNRAEFAFLEFACAKVGAILCPINTRAKTFELEHTLSDGEVRLLVMVDGFLKIDFVAVLGELVPPGAIGDAGAVAVEAFPHLSRIVTLDGPGGAGRAQPWDAFLAGGDGVAPEELEMRQQAQDWRNPVILQYTSGTTSRPKGALCNHRYVLYFAVEYMLRMGLAEGEAFLNTQPFYHNGGSCGALPVPLSLGCKAVSAEYYEPEAMMRLVESERCTVRTGYGAMYVMEMNHPSFGSYDLSSLRAGWCVGTPALFEKVRQRMGIEGLVQIYGSTEGSGCGGWVTEPWEVRSTSCGSALTGMELAIFDPETQERLPAGAPGEIRLRGWLMMNGYHRQPEATARAIDAEGWLRTGDLGWLDERGNLHFAGRLKDMLKIGGENVSAEEVEAILLAHPDIVQAAVIGAPDERLSEVVMALVERRAGASLGEDELIAWCRPRMANFRVPRHVRFVERWPLTDSGKIRKAKLREIHLPGGTDDPSKTDAAA